LAASRKTQVNKRGLAKKEKKKKKKKKEGIHIKKKESNWKVLKIDENKILNNFCDDILCWI